MLQPRVPQGDTRRQSASAGAEGQRRGPRRSISNCYSPERDYKSTAVQGASCVRVTVDPTVKEPQHLTAREVKRVLELVSTAAPQCPPPDAMLAVVDAKLDSIRNQIRALRETEQRVAKVKRYIEARDAESSP